jgi:membrane protein
MIALAAMVIAPIIFSVIGLSSFFSLAIVVLRRPSLLVLGGHLGRDLSLWAEPHRSALAMAFGRERGRSHRVADHLGSLLLVHRPFRRIQRNLWSLGAAIGVWMWMRISAIVILLGGELNAEIEYQTARDSTVGSEKPLGWRGAVMADIIGAARG